MNVKCKLHTPKLFEIRRVYTLVLNFPSSTKEYFAFSLITARFCPAILATLSILVRIVINCFLYVPNLPKYVNGFLEHNFDVYDTFSNIINKEKSNPKKSA